MTGAYTDAYLDTEDGAVYTTTTCEVSGSSYEPPLIKDPLARSSQLRVRCFDGTLGTTSVHSKEAQQSKFEGVMVANLSTLELLLLRSRNPMPIWAVHSAFNSPRLQSPEVVAEGLCLQGVPNETNC